mmetsp:Transcript_67470/g.152688  ORF Transcript_67470/g.152688 Transcript_67470/m.152688 type:complete len:226 (+) Transcript_67470:93-770(+)|eukprot:CAMPEP_0172641306 /NCGR_PEP_ID=MMETSP1068-20121228/226706_1 /TAXON_ID=35684 /ORGANISM="Pseudopedinella elastica, Strain CCMP716" /LENGTH=225 /DNA_ID=CAMNT_0013454863 /DNA_START=67 /DNA_END=744 /DNA_ORIENTATION=-
MSKRKGWNETIQAMSKGAPAPKSKRDGGGSKRDTRRRVNARRWIATSDSDDLRRKMEARLEFLEGQQAMGEDDEQQEEWQDEEEGESRGRKAKSKAARKIKKSSSGSMSSSALTAKRFRVRPLSQVLLDDCAARGGSDQPYVGAEGAPSRLPARRVCMVTGLPAPYKDPASGLPVASKSAQAQLKETPPPWLSLSGNAPYFEACRFIKSSAVAAAAATAASAACD